MKNVIENMTVGGLYILYQNPFFRRLTPGAAGEFLPFRYSNYFADTTFSMLITWGGRYRYAYRVYPEVLTLQSMEPTGTVRFSILRTSPKADASEAVLDVLHYCRVQNILASFEYVPACEIEMFSEMIRLAGYEPEVYTDEIYDDYLYEREAFLSLRGNLNKTKRGNYNSLLTHFPNLEFVLFQKGVHEKDCLSVFQKWCDGRTCGDCFYGCEQEAFLRFLDIYDENKHCIALAYDGSTPLGFAVSEQINADTESCYFQKSAERIRGLSYWLSSRMLELHPNIKWLNLSEDMGIPGLRMDKSSLHPNRIDQKYTILCVDKR